MQVTVTDDNGIILEELEIDENLNAQFMGIGLDGERLTVDLARRIVDHIEMTFEVK